MYSKLAVDVAPTMEPSVEPSMCTVVVIIEELGFRYSESQCYVLYM